MATLVSSAPVKLQGDIDLISGCPSFKGGNDIGPIPALYDVNGKYVEVVNLWFIHLVADKYLKDLSSYSRALLRYWRFIELHKISWDSFPMVKSLKPTYLFRNQDLLLATKKGDIAYSTANTYICHIIQFYLWAAKERYILVTESNKPFDIEFVRVSNFGMLAHIAPSLVIKSTDLRIRVKRTSYTDNLRSLNPLSQDEIYAMSSGLQEESVEFRLICALGLQCGLRIEEATTLTLTTLESAVSTSEINVRFNLKVGPSTGTTTKLNKPRVIEVAEVLLTQLKRYAISEKRLKRLNKKYFSFTHEPLFISQRGNAYTPASMQVLWSKFRSKMVLHYSSPFKHRFHDLRASYGTYRLHSLLEAGLEPADALDLLMGWMGHNNESTTWKYLRYLKRHEALKDKIFMLDKIMHEALSRGNHD